MKAQIMGVVNVTPDSFSDGGSYLDPEHAIQHCLSLIEDGADIIDIGAESSRPGSAPVSPETEWQRLGPVLDKLSELKLCSKLSIDTRHDQTMLRAAEYGIGWINNIAGLARDETMKHLANKQNLKYIAMHMRGLPSSMQRSPLKGPEAVYEVDKSLSSYYGKLKTLGFSDDRIYLDPGIGFGKDDQANFQLLGHTLKLAKKRNVLIGVSRKSFIGRALNIDNPVERDAASKMLELGLALGGVSIIRTHQVGTLKLLFNNTMGIVEN